MRMTVLRMSMPASAMSPSRATNPNGFAARLSASDAPTIPSGAVKNTMARREKLCIWIISSVSMARIMTGKRMKIELLPFWDSSIAPPISMRTPGGSESRIEASFGHKDRETSGGCTPSTTSATAVTTTSRSLRQMIGFSIVRMPRAPCPTGTAVPSRVAIVRSSSRSSAARSLGMARATTSTRSSPTLSVVTVAPPTSVCSVSAMSCGVRPSARLVALEPERRHLLAPIEMRVDQPRIGAHDVAHPLGGFAHDVRLVSNDAELNRKSNRRAEIESIEPDPRRAERAFGDRGLDARLDALAGFDIARDDDDLGERFVRLDRLEPEPEPGRTLADIGGIGPRVGVPGDQVFGLLHCRFGRLDRRAFSQPQLEKQFRPFGQGKELLLNPAELGEAQTEQPGRDNNDDDRAPNAELKGAAEGPVERSGVDCGFVARMAARSVVRQELETEIGSEQHRHKPRSGERDADDPEDAAGIFADRGIGEADRHEAGGGDQRSGQHRKRRRSPGEGRSALAVPALLELHHNHFGGDDRVVDQEPEGDDQRAERHPLQVQAEERHSDEDDRQHQRHRGRDDETGPPAERQEADRKHDRQRLDEGAGELADRRVDDLRLIGDARNRDPARQFGLEVGERRVKRLAEGEDIAALLHDDADLERGLPLGANEERRRILVAVRDFRHIAEAEGLTAGEDRGLRHRFGALLRAGHPHRQALGVGLEFAGGAKRVLLPDRIEHGLKRDAERGQFGVAELDKNAVRLIAVEIDLGDVGDALQAFAERLGDVLQLRV